MCVTNYLFFSSSAWVTLGSVESEFAGYTNERGFHGRIARLNAWNRALDFRTEIPKMVSFISVKSETHSGSVRRINGHVMACDILQFFSLSEEHK